MNTVRDTDRGAAALLARLKAHREAVVRVGILDDAPKKGEDGDGPETLAEIAVLHEFGGEHVPQRSFIRAGVDEYERDLRALQHTLAVQVFKGDASITVALDRLGAKAASLLQVRMARGIDPPNAPATIEAKGSSKPLIRYGQLRSGITWLVLA